MKRIIRKLSLVCLAVLTAAVLLAGCSYNADKENVTLVGGASSIQVDDFSILHPDGSRTPFTIPDNRFFIITDMDVSFSGAEANTRALVQLAFFDGVGNVSAFQDVTLADSEGRGGLQTSLTTGVKIDPETEFFVRVTSDIGPSTIVVNLHGYYK